MLNPVSLQLRVGVDVGSRCHTVAIGLSDGSLLEEFEIPHTAEGFREFFARVEDSGRRHATAEALAAYEAHRAEDRLMRAVNHYILGQRGEARALLRQVKPRRMLASARVQRRRLLVLFLEMKGLVRLPRIRPLADLFYRRWHGGGEQPKSC